MDWIPLSDRAPGVARVLVVRAMPDGARYVDVMTWAPNAESGLPPYPSQRHVTHWMPMPEPPPD